MRLGAIVALLVVFAGPLAAQEVQVSADVDGKIDVISSELARRLGLFQDVAGFREGRLFQLPDSSFVLELTASRRGGLVRERRPLSALAATEFRRDLTSRITTRAPAAALDQSGRTKLLVGSTILGLAYYGIATAQAFDPDDSRGAVAAYMLAAAGSFITPYVLTRKRAVSDGAATLALWGATRGPIHGWLVSELGDTDADKTRFGWSVALGLTEALAGGLIGQSRAMTPGQSEVTGTWGDIGMGTGFATASLFKLDQRTRSITVTTPASPPFTYQVNDRTLQSAVTLAGSALGLVAGYRIGQSGEWTRGDAYVFRNVVAISGAAGFAAADIIQRPRLVTVPSPGGGTPYSFYEDGFSSGHSAATLVGMGAGVMLGRALVSGRDFSSTQGTLLSLSPVAGALLGVGIAYLATPERQYDYVAGAPYRDPNDHSELYITSGVIGAVAGFAALYPAMGRSAKDATGASRLELSLNPLAVAQLFGPRRQPIMLGGLRYRF